MRKEEKNNTKFLHHYGGEIDWTLGDIENDRVFGKCFGALMTTGTTMQKAEKSKDSPGLMQYTREDTHERRKALTSAEEGLGDITYSSIQTALWPFVIYEEIETAITETSCYYWKHKKSYILAYEISIKTFYK